MTGRPAPPLEGVDTVVVDYGFTLSSTYYFQHAPPAREEWRRIIQDEVFASDWSKKWMRGNVSAADVAAFLAPKLGMDAPEVERWLRRGCRGLGMNERVVRFVRDQRAAGLKMALVTANFDLFTDVIVPDQRLDELFDVIVNSYDHSTYRKEVLWPIAFDTLGGGCGYRSSFLLEDTEAEVRRFIELGGRAHRYTTDEELDAWLARQQVLR